MLRTRISRAAMSACLAGVAIAGVLPAGAGAATQQRVGGYVVTWPTATTVPAGTTLRIGVRPASPAPRRPAILELLRLTDSGTTKGVVARHSVRRRTIAVRPAAAHARYRIRLTAGGRSVSRVIRTAARVPAPGGGTSTGPAPPALCGANATGSSATLTPSPAALQAGETLSLTLLNTGTDCLRTSPAIALRRQDGTLVPLNRPAPAILNFLNPGTSRVETLTLPADLAPGVYRAVMSTQSGPETAPVTQEVAAEFTVAP